MELIVLYYFRVLEFMRPWHTRITEKMKKKYELGEEEEEDEEVIDRLTNFALKTDKEYFINEW